MNSSKSIDVGASAALVELKAELRRKHDELRSQPADRGVSKSLRVKNESNAVKLAAGKNIGIEKRSQKDIEEERAIEKTYERAKHVLEAKARLYDEIHENALNIDEDHPALTNSLVDFQRKAVDRIKENRTKKPSSDGKWTEFTDSLGRTRRVPKSELAAYVAADKEWQESGQAEEPADPSLDELVRQEKRDRWEQQSAELSNKSKVHYQDVLFDEIREHGTGYYGFSQDDEQRAVQLAQLKKLSEETAASRKKIETEKKGKKAQLKERLKKVKARQRAKAGLPPLEESEESEEGPEKVEQEPEKVTETIDTEVHHPVDLRAWDFGKPGVYGPQPTSFDELDAKWLKDRREDRKSEFAPPSSYNQSKYSNFVKCDSTKRSYEPLAKSEEPQLAKRTRNEFPAPTASSSKDFARDRGGSEVAPPPTYEYYRGDIKRPRRTVVRPASDESVTQAIAQGIENFRKKFELKRTSVVDGSDSDSN